MPYPIEFVPEDCIVVVQIHRTVTAVDSFVIAEAIANMRQPIKWSILLDFRSMKESISNIIDWVMFVDRLRATNGNRIALLSSAVGHSTSCHLIAIWASGDDRHVQAFQDDVLARNWLSESC